MDNKPDAYVIIAELEDNTFRVITEKLNVREAREKLEIVQMKIRDKMFPSHDPCHKLELITFLSICSESLRPTRNPSANARPIKATNHPSSVNVLLL